MINKTKLALAIGLLFGGSTVSYADVIRNFQFSGGLVLRNAQGDIVLSDNQIAPGNSISWNYTNSTGTSSGISDFGTNFGCCWTAHSISLKATAPELVHADMIFDFDWAGASPLYSASFDFSIKVMGPNIYSLTTLDGDGDGIPGNAMTTGPFIGFSNAFDGVLTEIGGDHNNPVPMIAPVAVPVPAAAWLLGSGLLGLIGVARRKVA